MIDYTLISRFALNEAVWSGGVTTQLAIYPETADYAARNFLWRVSTAKINDEESVFTLLPGIRRIIMPLEGNLRLLHEGYGEVFLQPFHSHFFMGGWQTRSVGRVTDFNLMMAEGCDGMMEALRIGADRHVETPIFYNSQWAYNTVAEVFYFIDAIQAVLPDGNTVNAQQGDVLLLMGDNVSGADIRFHNPHNAQVHMVRAQVGHNR